MSPKMQRIGILVISIVMLVGTLGSFAMIVLANKNAQLESERQAQEQQKTLEAKQKRNNELSAKYYPVFKEYQNSPAPFDADAVGEGVTRRDLKEGTGEMITKDTAYQAYYIGWNPKGKVFDSSFTGDSLKPPLDTGQVTLIPGWYQGAEGMKVGGVREITIPASLAYGEQDKGENLPPNTPLRFIILVAEKS